MCAAYDDTLGGAAATLAETPPTSDFSPSSLRSRQKSEKLASPHNEYYYISIIDAFISLGMVRYIRWKGVTLLWLFLLCSFAIVCNIPN